MIKNLRCPKCNNLYSQQEYPLHSKYCKATLPQYTTQINTSNVNNNNLNNYLKNYNRNNTVNNHTVYTSNINSNGYTNPTIKTNNIVYTNPTLPNTSNTILYTNPVIRTNTNTNVILPQQIHPVTQVQNQYLGPQNISYYNRVPNQLNNYSQFYKNQANTTYPKTNIQKSTYKCKTCGKTLPLKEQKDHLLSHKLEQEEKDRLKAQALQDEDLFNNLSPEQIEQQRRIEEHIKRQRERQNNNNNNNNNIMMSDDDMSNMGMGNFRGINMNGFPNIIIRRTNNSNNNGMNNLSSGMGSPNFFENFFNGNMNDDFFNNPSSGNMRRIIIPMGGMGNMGMGGFGGQNDLNELIERMLHYSRENPTDAAILSELPENQIDDINKLDNDKKNCVICMEDFKNGDKSTNLPCLHMFHTNCIQSWLKTQNTCPICKFKLTQDNINNINRRG